MVFSGHRAVPSAIIEGGGGAYSYIRVLPDGFILKAIVFTALPGGGWKEITRD
jgi:hypothetical protein